MRCSIRWFKQFGLSVAALCMLLSLAEIGVRIYEAREDKLLLPETGLAELITPSTTTHLEFVPAATFVLSSSDDDRPISFRTNSYGIRGNEPVVPKPPGLFRILVLGDERILGAELPEAANVCTRLQELLNQSAAVSVEVLNGGVPGYCPLLSFLQLRQRLLALEPDLVILHFDMSDVSDDHRVRRFVKLAEGGLPLCATHPDALSGDRQRRPRLFEQFRISQIAVESFVARWSKHVAETDVPDIDSPPGNCRWAMDSPPDWALYIQQSLEPIAFARDLAEGRSARFWLTTTPLPWQVSATASNTPEARGPAGQPLGTKIASRHPFQILADFAETRQIVFLDATPRFESLEEPDSLWLRKSRGLSGRGHDEYARLLSEQLLQVLSAEWNTHLGRTPDKGLGTQVIR